RPMLPLYSDRCPRRKLPNAGDWANGVEAPLFWLPLIRRPSEARWLRSAEERLLSSAGLAPSVGWLPLAFAFRSVRWKPPCGLAGVGGGFLPLRLPLVLAAGGGGAVACGAADWPVEACAVVAGAAVGVGDGAGADALISSNGSIFISHSGL